jgi:hypothetical protein
MQTIPSRQDYRRRREGGNNLPSIVVAAGAKLNEKAPRQQGPHDESSPLGPLEATAAPLVENRGKQAAFLMRLQKLI